jgi:hypothetical protein
MSTVGVLPKDPVAVTEEFAVAAEDEDDDDDALDFDDPQPARTTQASKGMAMSARKRRMKTSMVVDVSFASLLALLTGGDDPPKPPRSCGDPSPQTPLGGDKPPDQHFYSPAVTCLR